MKTQNYPFIIPGTTKVNLPVGRPPTTPIPVNNIDTVIQYDYTVQPEDTLRSVAKKLFGNDSRHYRNILRMQGFETGATVHVAQNERSHNEQFGQ